MNYQMTNNCGVSKCQGTTHSYCWLTLWVLHYHLSMHLQTIKCGVTIASPRCSHMLHISLPVWVNQHVVPLHTPDITDGRYFAVSIIVNPGWQAWLHCIPEQYCCTTRLGHHCQKCNGLLLLRLVSEAQVSIKQCLVVVLWTKTS